MLVSSWVVMVVEIGEISFVDLVKILHCGGDRDVEQWLEPRNKFLVFAITCLLISISLYCLHLC